MPMYYVGIDLGGTNIAAGVTDEKGKLLHKDSIPTGSTRGYAAIIEDMAGISKRVIKDAGLDIKDVASIGIGVPGTPNNTEGIVVYACNIGFHNVRLREEMQKHINLPVYIDNDANCAALAENRAGAAQNARHSVTVTLGTGIGGGIIIDGKIYSGFNYAASELGHMVIVSGGEPCACGRKGCWEVYASATALIRQTHEAAKKNPESLIHTLVDGHLDKINAKTSFNGAKHGDETCRKVLDRYFGYLAEGLVNTINILQPEVVVIGGGISKEGETLLKPVRELVRQYVYTRDGVGVPQTRIAAAALGNDAGIIGAAMLGSGEQRTQSKP